MEEIQGRITKQGKRNAISRHLHAKNDKEQIAAWKSDLTRILHVFNVRSTMSVWLLLTLRSQTELAINTHVTVSDAHTVISNTHTMVLDIHRTIVQGQEGNSGRHSPVGGSRAPAITERTLIIPQTQTRSAV